MQCSVCLNCSTPFRGLNSGYVQVQFPPRMCQSLHNTFPVTPFSHTGSLVHHGLTVCCWVSAKAQYLVRFFLLCSIYSYIEDCYPKLISNPIRVNILSRSTRGTCHYKWLNTPGYVVLVADDKREQIWLFYFHLDHSAL